MGYRYQRINNSVISLSQIKDLYELSNIEIVAPTLETAYYNSLVLPSKIELPIGALILDDVIGTSYYEVLNTIIGNTVSSETSYDSRPLYIVTDSTTEDSITTYYLASYTEDLGALSFMTDERNRIITKSKNARTVQSGLTVYEDSTDSPYKKWGLDAEQQDFDFDDGQEGRQYRGRVK